MELVSDEILANNRIVRSANTTELYCIVCESDTSYATCANHIKNPSHLRQLDQFCSMFEASEDDATCKICKGVVIFDDLKVHAESHSLVPEFKLDENDDEYKIFFDNKIFQWKNLFRCCLCEVNFYGAESTLIHISEPKHQGLKEQMHNFHSAIPTTYKLLVQESLIAVDVNQLQCQICGGRNVVATSLERHVKGLVHFSLKSRFQLILNECETDNSVVAVDIKMLMPPKSDCEQVDVAVSKEILTVESICGTEASALNFILQRGTNNFYCMVCSCELSEDAIGNHTMEKTHEVALKQWGCDGISLKKGIDYYCGYCDCTILSRKNVYMHVTGKKHLKSLRVANEKKVLTAEKSLTTVESEPELRSLRQEFPCIYLSPLDKSSVLCMVCDCLVTLSDGNMNMHVVGKHHKKSLKKYGCEWILLRNENIYHCRCCNIVMNNLETIHVHIKETSHEHSVLAANNRRYQALTKFKNEVQIQCAASNPLELISPLLTDNRVMLMSTSAYCEVCQTKLGNNRREIDEHIADRAHINALQNVEHNFPKSSPNSYYCPFCKFNIVGIENIYYHLKDIAHIVRSKKTAGG